MNAKEEKAIRSINIIILPKDYNRLSKAKGSLSWRDFFMKLLTHYEETKDE